MTLTIGMLSTARINAKLAAGARASSRTRVVAIASRQLERAEAQARELGIERRATAATRRLLADPGVDAVYISLPNEMHHEWTMQALAAGKHVLCEKPYSRSAAAVEEAFAAAEAAGLVLAEAFMWRHHPQALRLAELIADGAIGDLRLVRAAFSFLLDDPRDVRLLEELDGGGTMDVGCYCISGARLLAGDPVSVTAQQLLAPSGVDRRLVATLAHEGDVLTHFDCALDLPDRSDLEVDRLGGRPARQRSLAQRAHGHRARARRRAQRALRDSSRPTRTAASWTTSPGPSRESTRRASARADALGQARTIDAVLRAAASGRREAVG